MWFFLHNEFVGFARPLIAYRYALSLFGEPLALVCCNICQNDLRENIVTESIEIRFFFHYGSLSIVGPVRLVAFMTC